MIPANLDTGTLVVCLLALLAIVAYVVRDAQLLAPEPTTPRPEPEEYIDLSEAIRPIGPLAPWETTRKES